MREFPIDRVLRPLDRFIRDQSNGGLVLFISAAIAVFLAKSPWRDAYHHFWEHSVSLQVGTFVLERDLLHLINDGLMAMFFFLVALELKHEFIAGQLSDPKDAVLPIAASVGGMTIPALIYLYTVGFDGEPSQGWGITLGTDTAFVLGLLAVLGNRVPAAIKALFITVSVTDDIASVSVIALFYTSDLSMSSLGLGLAFLVALLIMNILGVRNMTAYAVVGVGGVWLMFLLSGVHATVAGVLAALCIPARVKMDTAEYANGLRRLATDFEEADDPATPIITRDQAYAITKVKRFTLWADTPLQRLEQMLNPWVAFLVLPLFALANAGIELPGSALNALAHPITLGVFLGLIIGKPLGILSVCWVFVKLGWGKLGEGVDWFHMIAISVLSGLGFTMAIFISELAFSSQAFRDDAKLGILFASVTAGVLGTMLFLRKAKKDERSAAKVASAGSDG